jgi:hypothetical protein
MADDLIAVRIWPNDEDLWDMSRVNEVDLQGIVDQRARYAHYYPQASLPHGGQVYMVPAHIVERYERLMGEVAELDNLINATRSTAPTMRMAELARDRGFEATAKAKAGR